MKTEHLLGEPFQAKHFIIIGLVILGGFLLTVPLIVGYLQEQVKISDTQELVEHEAKRIIKQDLSKAVGEIKDEINVKEDAWDNKLIYRIVVTEEGVYVLVTSAGPDGVHIDAELEKVDTFAERLKDSDDIFYIKQDLNKSRIIGKWAGSRLKEFGKGLLDGFKKESKFKEPKAEKE